MLEPVLYEIRENYIRHPALVNIDSFKQTDHNRYKVEAHYITNEPLDDSCIKTNATWTLNSDQTFTCDGCVGVEHDSIILQKYSPSGKIKAVIRQVGEGSIIEIFKNGALWYRKPVPASTHGAPIKSSVLMADWMLFSEDENRVLYVADDPEPTASIYKLKEEGVKRMKYKDSLGDRLTNHCSPSIFIFDLQEKQVFKVAKPVETADSRVIYIQPQFADKEGKSIYCVSLNLVGVSDQALFTNYPKQIVHFRGLDVSKSIEGPHAVKTWKIEPETFKREGEREDIAFLPKLSPDFKKVSYFYINECPGPALNSCGLKVMDRETGKIEVVVAEQEEDGIEFAGISGNHISLCKYDWLNKDVIVFNSCHHQTYHMYEVSLASKVVSRINKTHKHFKTEATFFLTKLDENILIGKRDCLYRNYLLFAMRRNPDGSYTELGGMEPEEDDKAFEYFEEEMELGGIEGTFYGMKTDEAPMHERPLVLHIHGGPHSIWMNIHHPLIYMFVKNGATVLNINYTGSLGRGNKFAKSLCGNICDVEVKEIKAFIDKLIEDKKCDPAQINIYTGSFGGYIALKLLHDHPDLVHHASIFNPVTNGFSLYIGSTAQDWIFSEILGEQESHFKYNRNLTKEEVAIFRKKSPLFFEDFKFKAQVVFFTGLKDDVVPPLSTRALYKRLRANGLQVQLYEYPTEEHIISTVGPNFDFNVKTAILFAGLLPF